MPAAPLIMSLNLAVAIGALLPYSPIMILPIGSPLIDTSKNARLVVILSVQPSVLVVVVVLFELSASCASFVSIIGGFSSSLAFGHMKLLMCLRA